MYFFKLIPLKNQEGYENDFFLLMGWGRGIHIWKNCKFKTIFLMNYQGLMSHRASYCKRIIFRETNFTSGLHKPTLPTICFV